MIVLNSEAHCTLLGKKKEKRKENRSLDALTDGPQISRRHSQFALAWRGSTNHWRWRYRPKDSFSPRNLQELRLPEAPLAATSFFSNLVDVIRGASITSFPVTPLSENPPKVFQIRADSIFYRRHQRKESASFPTLSLFLSWTVIAEANNERGRTTSHISPEQNSPEAGVYSPIRFDLIRPLIESRQTKHQTKRRGKQK